MEASELNEIAEKIKKVLDNFSKSPNRRTSNTYLDKKSVYTKELLERYIQLYDTVQISGHLNEQLEAQLHYVETVYKQIAYVIGERKQRLRDSETDATNNSTAFDDNLSDDSANTAHCSASSINNSDSVDLKANTIIVDSIVERSVAIGTMASSSGISFMDVEASLEKFDGVSANTNQWIVNYEKIADTCGWNNVQKYIFCRRLLSGAARLAVEADDSAVDFATLKVFLLANFSFVAKDIYEELRSMKKIPTESNLEFAYRARRIAKRGNVDDPSLVSYIVRGLGNVWFLSPSLYESKTFEELKNKLEVYDHTRPPRTNFVPIQRVSVMNSGGVSQDLNDANTRKCFKCDQPGHIARDCRTCFKCGVSGHMARFCRLNEPQCSKCRGFGHTSQICPSSTSASVGPSQQAEVNHGTSAGQSGNQESI